VSWLSCVPWLAAALAAPGDDYEAEALFPPERLHNHGSCIVEYPRGSLFVVWYRGSGERKADDVQVMGSRRRIGSKEWEPPFVLADTPGFPDANPCAFVDPRGKLWLLWPVILANEWHTALLQYKVTSDAPEAGVPRWEEERTLLLRPGPEFSATIDRLLPDLLASVPPESRARAEGWAREIQSKAREKLSTRLGWMPRVHPIVLDARRILVPLYSDGFDMSLIAISDDWGATWRASAPLVGGGAVQPSLTVRKDGTIVAHLRDNGLPPHRVLRSESKDRGETWTMAQDTSLPNPGAGLETIVLKDGPWVLVNNDTEQGRHSLAVSLSEDEGRAWRWTRHLEPRADFTGDRSASYPSIIEASDGRLHVTYSRSTEGETIFHAAFSIAWVRAGEH
jgi:predicted neuraminidase